MMALVCLAIGYGLWRVAVVVGYLSDRHALMIVVCLMPWALAALVRLGTLARRASEGNSRSLACASG